MKIGKMYNFEAAHHLPNHKGKCARLHGHSYKLEVEVEGNTYENPNDSEYGMVMDFEALDEIVDVVVSALDHTDLNENPLTKNMPTTAESLVHNIADLISHSLDPGICVLRRVRLWETARSYAEWLREDEVDE